MMMMQHKINRLALCRRVPPPLDALKPTALHTLHLIQPLLAQLLKTTACSLVAAGLQSWVITYRRKAGEA